MAASEETDRGADGLAAWIAPARTALLVIDIQVDFASPEGVLGRAGVDMAPAAPAIAAAERLVEAARAAGVTVVFIALQTSAERDSPVWLERMRRQGGDPSADAAICRAGTRGADFVGPTPRPGELVSAKHKYSAFVGTDLEMQLRSRGVDTLVACGLATECCVDSTVRDAFHRDFHAFVVGDACAAYEQDLHDVTLKSLARNCAIVTDSGAVVGAWGR